MTALPFVRALDSGRFRLLVAGLLFVVGLLGLGGYLVSRASEPLEVGQFGIDFADYHAAAVRISQGISPYDPVMLAGPIAAEGTDRYRYPPPFAQLLLPLAGLPVLTATWIWLAIQSVCLLAATWLAGTAAGLPRSVERLLWSGAAVTWFLPDLDALWKGNLSGVQTLFVALLLAPAGAAGGAAAANGLLKLTPAAMAPIALLRSRRDAVALVVVTIAVVAASLLLAPPAAWSDYLTVVGNLLRGSADYPANLAPAQQLGVVLGLGAPWSDVVRLATLGLGLGLLGLGLVWARRPGGWPGAATAGVAGMLLLPAAIWFHYLALLLPLAVFAWARATRRQRAALAIGGGAVSVGVAWLPLALGGAFVLVGAALVALRPGPRA
ncbi:MAG: glycosyltransferase family 87 protein [Candidatus Limnocylindrales bacterium]